MSNYWGNRLAKAQAILFNKNQKQIDRQVRKIYKSLSRQVIDDFEATYEKVLAQQIDGKPVTPADLYKLDKYWQLNGQLQKTLDKLGKKQYTILHKLFKIQYEDIYNSINIDGSPLFSTIDDNAIEQVINQIWCADGKSWSQRIWENTKHLQATLNDGLIHCVATGKKTSELKRILQERFNVSYGRTDALVRTELAHIQTQAAKQRYRDYGIQQMEVWVDEDERTCPICAKHEGKVYSVNDKMPVPFHPRCRCCMIPIVKVPPKADE